MMTYGFSCKAISSVLGETRHPNREYFINSNFVDSMQSAC